MALQPIYSCLSEMDKVQLALTCRRQRSDFVHLEDVCWNNLMISIIPQEGTTEIYLTDENGKQERTRVISLLGFGAFKTAWGLENGNALLLQNMGGVVSRNMTDIRRKNHKTGSLGLNDTWRRSVNEEVGMAKHLKKLDLLTPESRKVRVALTKTALQGSVPAFISRSFAEFSRQGIIVVDHKIFNRSIWKMPRQYSENESTSQSEVTIFRHREDGMTLENWKLVFDPLLTDIAKIYLYGIPCTLDSFHLAVIKKPNGTKVKAGYEIRYFGFDFSHTKPLPFPQRRTFNKEEATALALQVLNPAIDGLVWNQFAGRPPNGLSSNLKLNTLRTALSCIEDLSKQITAPS